MKKLFAPFAILCAIIFTGIFALAQSLDLPSTPTTVVDVIASLSALIGGTQGMTTLAIAALVAQFLSKFVLSPLWDSLGLDVKYKFVVFGFTQIALAVIPLMVQGQTFMQAISGGAILLVVVQYGYRIYELFFENKEA